MPKKIKYKYIIMAALVGACVVPIKIADAGAETCPDVKIIFARGSGAERWENDDYKELRNQLATKLKDKVHYEIEDLDYPAVGIGVDNINVLIGAAVGAGDAYEFGASVDAGVEMLTREVNETCTKTQYVVAGYSQGAMVISKALPRLNPNKIIYAATFGDPKIYLPEGKGPIPDACLGQNFSEYREYVPDCMVYKGLLGAYMPYQPAGFGGKVGTWCNTTDIFCSTSVSIASHTAYVTDEIYKSASEKIAEKILAPNRDIIILFNVSWLNEKFYDKYRDAALTLGKDALGDGARVALYLAHTTDDGDSETAKVCNFDECTAERLEKFFNDEIRTLGYYMDDDGKPLNNMLGAGYAAVTSEKWRNVSEKILVIYSKEDYDKSLLDMVRTAYDGKQSIEVVDGEVNLGGEKRQMRLAAPRVQTVELPAIKIINTVDSGDVTINFENSGTKAIVMLNDAVLGTTSENEITISEIDRKVINIIRIVPLNDTRRGEGVEVEVLPTQTDAKITVPNAGRR